MRLLLVEDEPKIADFIKRGLGEEHHAVDVAESGEDAVALVDVVPYDLVILDLMLPDMDGLEVCRSLRLRKQEVPILMLTARGTLDDRVAGLEVGADDYLVKPFAFAELLARTRALLRRQQDTKTASLQVCDLTLDTVTHEVVRAGKRIELSRKEYEVLVFLMRNAGKVLTRDRILEALWGYDFQPASNVVDVYIRSLRQKVDDPHSVKLLETVRGSGYRMRLLS